ncbi:hypothetical protein SAMN05192533_101414 [Mesobacillus persicus]|uniref:Uncharacterized protein n=1 Tax=Mesobacillus persicus TaxID=930146 RepID=A0A1H7WGR5_9BACI|nr:hypothetical protein [Mesobacillus persicus]SEM20670.1 hypothetical protein SAMN05192533_101414 [Mesobacillus persicus]
MQKIVSILLFSIFLGGTIAVFSIVYNDFDHPISFTIVIAYVIYLLLYSAFLLIVGFKNLVKLRWRELRKRIVTLFIWSIALSAAQFMLSPIFKNSVQTIYDWGIPLGIAFGITFSDLLFTAIKKDRE